MSWEKFQSKLSTRGRNVIAFMGITNLEQLKATSVSDILKSPRVGNGIAAEIQVAAALAGVELAESGADKRTARLASTKMLGKIVQRHGYERVREALRRYEAGRRAE